jgi:hypothetical protein
MHYHKIPKEQDQERPRAFEYFDFFASLTAESLGGWRRIDLLKDARPGDIIGWRFITIETDENTGHVVIVADAPTADSLESFSVRVCDSAAEPHFDDTRGDGPKQWPAGVGSGTIKFKVDGAGRPIAYLFAPPDSAEFSYVDIAIGRAEPL